MFVPPTGTAVLYHGYFSSLRLFAHNILVARMVGTDPMTSFGKRGARFLAEPVQ